MRRADRLFLIIHALRGRRTALPARTLAETLAVSLRTVYRDVADLQLSGVPIEGEAGIGYLLRKGADIPPLMFNADELEALVVGTRFVRAFGGKRLSVGARSALLKIQGGAAADLQARAQRTRTLCAGTEGPFRIHRPAGSPARGHRATAGAAVPLRRSFRRGNRARHEPLCLAFWGGSWTLGAWCRFRRDFRNFRPDRILQLDETGEIFADDPERGLEAYFRRVGPPPSDA